MFIKVNIVVKYYINIRLIKNYFNMLIKKYHHFSSDIIF